MEYAGKPLALRMRPEKLDDFFGQEELVSQGKLLRQAIESDSVPSMIFWGP
ncbi:MAG: replication-associated recombination protein A, partial [Candidatus Pacebacteria bacterium]|nr:replication-associated recombination protein A [Candidatus Paceibacterota bacterium]